MFGKGVGALGIGLQALELYGYYKLYTGVKEWGEQYRKWEDAQLDEAWAMFHGASGGAPVKVDPPVDTTLAKPKRDRAAEARIAYQYLAQALAELYSKPVVQTTPDTSSDTSTVSSGGGSDGAGELVPNPCYSPTGIPFGPQPPMVPANMLRYVCPL
jgi:hypothetical protein